uniref:Ground-like domain-containing protein n=1 Tax=Acrobeloides nanus TaxID=290746 RepID=A0A914C462_9BILA
MFVSPLRNHGFHRRSRDEVYSEQRSRLVAPASDSYQNSVTSEQEPIYAPASQPNIGPSSKVSSRFDEETYAQRKQPKYPLPECYTNDSGFMCCNKELESVMDDAFDELKNRKNSNWHSCNVQQIANGIQKAIEGHFNSTFEVIAGIGDYASKSHFYHNYICKMERDNRFLLAYATPKLGAEFPQNPQNGLGNVFGPPQEPKYKNGPGAPYAHVWTL